MNLRFCFIFVGEYKIVTCTFSKIYTCYQAFKIKYY